MSESGLPFSGVTHFFVAASIEDWNSVLMIPFKSCYALDLIQGDHMAKTTDYMINALLTQGVSHVFIGLGRLNDNFMPALSETKGLRTVVAAYMADGYS